MVTNWEFQSKRIYTYSLKIQWEFQMIDSELECHSKLINDIMLNIELKREKLKEKYKTMIESNIDEITEDNNSAEIDKEYHDFYTFKEIYLNSLYINIYSIFENALFKLCVNYCNMDYKKLKKVNLSQNKLLLDVLSKTAKIEFLEILSEFTVIDTQFRILRNCLIHSRYTCKSNDIKNLKDVNGLRFSISGYHGKMRPEIENEGLLIDFINKVRYLLKGVYVLFHNKIIADRETVN